MEPNEHNDRRWSFIQATILGLMTALLGYAVGASGSENLGAVVFFLAPVGTGFVVAQFVQKKLVVAEAAFCIGCAAAGVLVAAGYEGLLCCILASPILWAGFAFGWFLGQFTTKNSNGPRGPGKSSYLIFLLLFPSLLATGRAVENATYIFPAEQTVTTSIHVPCSPAQAWRYIKEIERLEGSLPLLLKLGLPVPTSCTLSAEGVGGERICNFRSGGVIRQRVTIWEPSSLMAFDITGCSLQGRGWLKFIDASYDFLKTDSGTTVVRHTRIQSALTPRFYWKPLEALGVRAEHDYILENLLRHTINDE